MKAASSGLANAEETMDDFPDITADEARKLCPFLRDPDYDPKDWNMPRRSMPRYGKMTRAEYQRARKEWLADHSRYLHQLIRTQ